MSPHDRPNRRENDRPEQGEHTRVKMGAIHSTGSIGRGGAVPKETPNETVPERGDHRSGEPQNRMTENPHQARLSPGPVTVPDADGEYTPSVTISVECSQCDFVANCDTEGDDMVVPGAAMKHTRETGHVLTGEIKVNPMDATGLDATGENVGDRAA